MREHLRALFGGRNIAEYLEKVTNILWSIKLPFSYPAGTTISNRE